jgi:hypothetical protein
MQELHLPSDPGLVEVPVASLQAGMFVAELDRPWLDTPFAVQGFVIRDDVDVDYVAKFCSYVYIDPLKKVTAAKGIAARPKTRGIEKDPVSIKAEFGRAQAEFESAEPASRYGPENDFTNRNTTFMTWNLMHLARMIKDAGGMPAHGNQRSEWDAGCRFDFINPDYR